jgi:hypothetical protein
VSETSQLWRSTAYGSGTQVVQRESWTEAYYHVGHLAADTEGDAGRFDVSSELCEWLNGGPEPWWLDLVCRKSDDMVVLPHGCEITATGPMIDRAVPPAWGDWVQDNSEDAKIARGRLIDVFIINKRS